MDFYNNYHDNGKDIHPCGSLLRGQPRPYKPVILPREFHVGTKLQGALGSFIPQSFVYFESRFYTIFEFEHWKAIRLEIIQFIQYSSLSFWEALSC